MIMKTQTNNKLPSRESETREKSSRRKPWAPPSQLDAPPAPAGFKHRWIRAETVGQIDNKNISSKLREGWEFVRADEYPNMEWPSIDSGKYNGVIAVGGLMLARIPEETVAQRNAYFQQLTKDKDEAIANDPLKDQHPSMPVSSESRSRVSFGGKKPS
tara:strand:+ start:272 stop:745 length:474 start_codon:yes stop_codon:yes gene_type:complete